jgi:hypothetical protein
MSKAAFKGKVVDVLRGSDRHSGLEKTTCAEIELRFDGIAGDAHAGLTRKSDSRTLMLYPRNIAIANVRQLTLVSDEELRAIALAMGLASVKPEWLGANVVIAGIPDLTLLPPSSRLQFPSGATVVVDMENAPCRQVAEVIARHHPESRVSFVQAATHRRGVTAWVEREGKVAGGDDIAVWLPPLRTYAHA